MNPVPCYVSGRPYRGLHARWADTPRPRDCRHDQVIALTSSALPWTRLWEIVDATLRQHGYGVRTRRLYRTVLRRFAAFAGGAPAQATPRMVEDFVRTVDRRHGSWAWTAMTISVLRTVFDKLGGCRLVTGLRTPKRPQRLPEILDFDTVRRVLAAASTTRDQLLLGLLYGCGLKPSEACGLRWGDVDTAQRRVRIRFGRGRRERWVKLPPDLLPVLELGVARCAPTDFVFQGRRAGTALSARRVELILREAAAAAGLGSGVTCMRLRHAFAVHCLENGASIRALQEALGHQSVITTLEYTRCLLPPEVTAAPDGRAAADSLLSAVRTAPEAPTAPSAGEPTAPVSTGAAESHAPATPCSPAPLFEHPVSVAALELPLRDETGASLLEKAAAFYRLLKTQIFGRFLGLRRTTVNSS